MNKQNPSKTPPLRSSLINNFFSQRQKQRALESGTCGFKVWLCLPLTYLWARDPEPRFSQQHNGVRTLLAHCENEWDDVYLHSQVLGTVSCCSGWAHICMWVLWGPPFLHSSSILFWDQRAIPVVLRWWLKAWEALLRLMLRSGTSTSPCSTGRSKSCVWAQDPKCGGNKCSLFSKKNFQVVWQSPGMHGGEGWGH